MGHKYLQKRTNNVSHVLDFICSKIDNRTTSHHNRTTLTLPYTNCNTSFGFVSGLYATVDTIQTVPKVR